MSTAPQVGSQSEHDWLVVGTTTLPPTWRQSTTWQQRLDALISGATEPLGTLNQYLSRRVRRERRGSYPSASQSSGAIFPQFVAALGRRLPGVGNHVHSIWRWLCEREFIWLRAHPIVAMFALGTIFPLAYLIYCIATVPSDGGLVIEPTPSALVVEADGGQVFATRGVFKGDKLSSEDVRLTFREPLSPSKTATFTITQASICRPWCVRRIGIFFQAARAREVAPLRNSSCA
jgi:hypothetical protein